MEWLKQQGPWCPALVDYLRRHHQQYDVLVFFTYLYAPTVLGLEVAPGRSVLVPTAHDEPAIRLGIFKEVFGRAEALCYLTESERQFVQHQFADRPLLEEVIGVGVDIPAATAVPAHARDPPMRDGAPGEGGERRVSLASAWRAARCSDVVIVCTEPSSSTADASIPARGAKS